MLHLRLFIKMQSFLNCPSLRFGSMIFVVLFCAQSARGNFIALGDMPQNPPEVRSLQLGQPVERELKGGEIHSFRVTAQPGQFLHVVVEQRGIDVKLTLFSPDGQKLLEVDNPTGEQGPEAGSLIAAMAGDYRIEVASEDKKAKPGRYEARLETLRAATDADRIRVRAEQAGAEAEHLADGNAAAKRQALEKYAEALELWRQLNDSPGIAKSLDGLGGLHLDLREYPNAAGRFQEALPVWRALKDQFHEAETLHNLAVISSLTGDRSKAVEFFLQALPLRRAVKDTSGEALTLNNLAVTYSDLGDFRKSQDTHRQALAVRRTANDRRGQAQTLNNLGLLHDRMGEKRKAIDYFQQALQLRRALRDAAGEAQTLNNLAALYRDLGNQQQALNLFADALRLRRAARDTRGEAVTLMNLGRCYELLGAPQEALTYYNQALPIFRSLKDRAFEGRTLNFMGLAHGAAGDYPQALNTYEQALPIRRELKDKAGEAATLNNIGLAHEGKKDFRQAVSAYDQALPLIRSVGDPQSEARILNNLGFSYDALGEKVRALDYHQQALKLSREVGDRLREAKVRYGIAKIESFRNRLKPAREQIEQSIKIVEALRASLANPETRALYRASVQQYYDLYIDVLMRMGKRLPKSGLTSTALQVSEQARARSLVELLTEANADIRQGADATLVERERELQEQINDKTTEQIRLLGSRGKADQIAEAGKEIERLNRELRETQGQIRSGSPRYANLTQPQPLAAREIQGLLDANTMLLEFSLGEERSYLWAVTPTAVRSFALPKRELIEASAKRFYELATARNQYLAKESNQQKQERIADADAETPAAATALGRMLLAQVAPLLGKKRLIIVADGALQYVPFSALSVVPGNARYQPLVASHEILFLPSATTLAVLRREAANRGKASKTVAVIADPVFEARDERIKVVKIGAEGNASAKPPQAAPPAETDPSRILLYKSGKESGAVDAEFRIPRLPNTRREAETILSLAAGDAGKAAFDFAASRAAATSEDLGQYRILHFATHGFLNSLNPELSGLVLSLVDEQGKPQNGYLLAPEIYNLKLPATELVVLSACQTGLGREIRGEGIIGLTRGFMYAGAPRVVVSLWSVNDRSTADLMKSFYESMLAKGQRPSAALRIAQLELIKLKNWRAPYFWAAFGQQGEWR